jgi:para-aminobenzoate synthetase component I
MAVMPLDKWTAKADEFGKLKQPFFFAIDFEGDNAALFSPGELADAGILYDFHGKRNFTPPPQSPPMVNITSYPGSIEQYAIGWDKIIKAIMFGDSFLANYTFKTRIDINLSLKEVFLFSQARYKWYWPSKFVVFSPEKFVQIKSGRMYTFPMKGTAIDTGDRSVDELMADVKEYAEQATVVDLMRNDLSIHALDVQLDRFRYLEKLDTSKGSLWQSSSQISGRLAGDFHEKIGTIITDMLPAGSISGAPKLRTVALIREAEEEPRGWYTGVCGYFDGSELDSAVMIRYIEEVEGAYSFRSGGGITSRSELEKEFQEMLDKVYVPIY